MTTKDLITACALTSFDYNSKFAKKMLNQVILEFRDAFSFNPGIYKDLEEDMADYDTALEFPTMQEMFENWQDPFQAD